MKKIKKIFPLLLGVMILMFGTLTVSAAESDTVSENAKKVYSAGVAKIESNKWEDMGFKYFLLTYSSNFDYYKMIVSDVPLRYVAGSLRTSGNGASYNFFTVDYDVNKDKMSYAGISGGTNTIADKAIINFGDSFNSLYANYDVYSSDSVICIHADKTGFFPGPPVAQVAVALPPVVQNQAKVILITAIACLALLVILLVLPKKLPRFLNK